MQMVKWILGQAAAKLDVKPTPAWPERKKLQAASFKQQAA